MDVLPAMQEARLPLRIRTAVRDGFHSWVFKGVVVVSAVLSGLVLLELGLRLFSPQPIIPRYIDTAPYGIRRNIAHVDGEMSAPEYRHRITTNSVGFRGRKEYAVTKPTGTYRILALGDSVTLGHGVGDEHTFAALLEQKLSSVRPTEVINMGVSGFGTAEELIQLRQVGLAYQPDLVILGYFPNDPYNNIVSRLFKSVEGELRPNETEFAPVLYVRDRLYTIPGWALLCQHSHLVNLVRNRASGYFIHRLAVQNHVPADASNDLTEREAVLTGGLLNEINRELGQRRIPLVILNIPLVAEGRLVQNLPRDRIKRVADSPYVIDVAGEVYRSHPLHALSYEKDGHPTLLGHKLIADRLAQLITGHIWQ
jgi:lysophospholipase L1-like esterase